MTTTRGTITIRRSDERGRADFGWLDTRYTFSFGDYHDPEHMGFRDLRVINEDFVAPSNGFPRHPHRDMEILTYVLEGAVEHGDSEGNGGIVRAGDVQRMTAGRGIVHSEANPSSTETLHLLQIWILPEARGLDPGYEQTSFSADDKRGRLRLIASRDGAEGSVRVHQDVRVLATVLEGGESVREALDPARHAWVQVARGRATVNGTVLDAGDGAAISGADELVIEGVEPTEVLVFDLN
jgi:hypothetical protein